MNETTFENKCAILAELWIENRYDTDLADFMEYNDLGLPLAYAIHNQVVEPKPRANTMISETFDMLLNLFDLTDEGWQSLDDLLSAVQNDN